MANPSSWFTAEGSSSVAFGFIEITGSLIPAVSRPERVIYPGVDGVGYWVSGKRGEPFQLTTICDFANEGQALTNYKSYTLQIGRKLDLHYHGALWATCGILDVTFGGTRRLAVVQGGVNVSNGNAGFLLTATWQIESLA